VAVDRRAAPSSHNRIEAQGIDLAVIASRRAAPSSHNRIEARH
jgi:hypothetical protein